MGRSRLWDEPREPSVGIGGLVVAVIALAILAFIIIGANRAGSVPASTAARARLDANVSYQTDNVYDGLGWIDESRVSRSMKEFYDKTGIQPALAIFDYMPGVTGDDMASEQYAKDWYDAHVDGEGGLLLAYFDTGTDEEGWAYLIYGDLTKSVMDAEAEDIFWAYYDRYWTDNGISLDEAYPAMFNKTAERIMQKTTTGMDVLKYVMAGFAVIIITGAILVVMKTRRQHEAERAAETERILNTPLSGGPGEGPSSGDPLLDQYSDRQS